MSDKKRLNKKIALVTGASRGVGASVSKKLSIEEGAHVILCARTVGALEEIYDEIISLGGEATIVPFDLKDFNKIVELASVIASRFGKLDILVGNAAYHHYLSPVAHIEPKVWEQSIFTNVTANLCLIKNFDPLLRKSDFGRALFVTSDLVGNPKSYWGAYLASKAALEKIVEIYALEVAKTPIRVNLISLDSVSTDMRATCMPGEDSSLIPTPEDIAGAFIEPLLPTYQENGKIIKINKR